MAEMVVWRGRRRRKGMLDRKGFAIPLPEGTQVQAMLRAAGEAAPAFLLSMAEVLDMPSGLHAAYIAGLAALGKRIRFPLAGAALGMLLRLLSGVDPRWEGVVTLLLLAGSPLILAGRNNFWLVGGTVVSLLPLAVRGCLGTTAAEMLLSLGAVVFSALCAPILCRGVRALTATAASEQAPPIAAMEDRVGVAMLFLLAAAGGARLLAIGVNVGAALVSAGVLLLAMQFGAMAGCGAGILAGTMLSLTGLPGMLAVALAAGGFLAGTVHALGKRRLTCVAFAAATTVPILVTGAGRVGCALAVPAASLIVALLPMGVMAQTERFLRRFRTTRPQAGNAYAASVLAAWEKTVDAMALSVPSPLEAEPRRDAVWWTEHLCDGCPERPRCPGVATENAVSHAEAVWGCRETEDPVWRSALEGLRGLGCQRLHHLMRAMDDLRREEVVRQRNIRRALDQRSMLVTHLTAMAGAARRFAYLSAGENWWDMQVADRIRRALAESATPAQLTWVRRVQGHVEAAFCLESITGARRQAEILCDLTAAASGVPMATSGVDGANVRLSERPPLEIYAGLASAPITGEEKVCGDTAWCGLLQDGRCMAALSDGMGHGAKAALASRQTVELLRLCLDAGYTLQQALTAVNGMMLLSGQGERFTTVDLVTIDLWTGQTAIEKLGAAASWLHQQGRLQQVTGDALPLGILESIESGGSACRLREGDAIILLTDGVEEAFSVRADLEDAILVALMDADPQQAAENLLASALKVGGGVREDDQTVLILRADTVQNVENMVS